MHQIQTLAHSSSTGTRRILEYKQERRTGVNILTDSRAHKYSIILEYNQKDVLVLMLSRIVEPTEDVIQVILKYNKEDVLVSILSRILELKKRKNGWILEFNKKDELVSKLSRILEINE